LVIKLGISQFREGAVSVKEVSFKEVSMQTASLHSPLPQPLLLPALREGTGDLHERIESRLDLASRLDSLGTYQALLERFYGFYTTLEEGLAAPACTGNWVTLGLLFGERRKTHLLEADLRFLGVTTADLVGLKRCPGNLLPTPASAAELVGCAYVVEGASLGGQVIGRLVEQALGLRPGAAGARFFYGYGSRTGVMWQQFRRAAEAFVVREDKVHPGSGARISVQAVTAARQTFTSMDAWLIDEGDTLK
jgi:heme oxygenase